MPQRKIITEPDTILRKKSATLEKVDNDLRVLMDDMLETMYASPGRGLAGVQVGVLKRLIVIDVSGDKEKKNPLCFINTVTFLLTCVTISRYPMRYVTVNALQSRIW